MNERSQPAQLTTDDGAFPIVHSDGVTSWTQQFGLTKRELFAAHLMASICTTHSGGSINADDAELGYLARKAVCAADALLKELAK
jgi:hypothetical protein